LSLSLNYDSPAELKKYLESRNMGMQKKFGQNFLINPNARKSLIDSLDAKPGDSVWEIGPGLGAMTAEMLRREFSVKAFEIDRGFIEALKDLFSDEPNLEIVPGDVLKTWKKALPAAPFLLGNLPYNIGASIIADFIEQQCFFSRIVVTVQKEVAQRMAAKPGSSDYSSFTVLCNMAYTVKPLMVLKGASFYPPPHVDSQGVCLNLKADVDFSAYPAILTPMVRTLFSSRRKTVQNNLQTFISSGIMGIQGSSRDLAAAALDSCGISPMERAERLSLDEFSALASAIMQNLEK
jgi:16S rRNA (adenine1518-N6/adenine1519-N6)-dimethyltransferase